MRLFALFLSVLLSVQMTCSPSLAAAVSFTPSSGGLQGKVPCNKIGSLLLADGLALMSGNTIEITGQNKSDNSSKSTSQLSGQLLKVATSGSSSHSSVTGYASFSQGPGLPSLNKGGSCSERVDLNDGSSVKGPISSVSPDQIVCAGRSIPMGSVAGIHSASVFKFSMGIDSGDAQKISFEPTCIHAAAAKEEKQPRASTPSNPSEHKVSRIVVSLVCVALIACAIAIPIAVACSGRHHHNNNNNQLANVLLIRSLTSRKSTPPPTPQESSSSSP